MDIKYIRGLEFISFATSLGNFDFITLNTTITHAQINLALNN